MSTPYAAGFDKSEIRCLPGCAFWEDATGLMFLGYTREGGTLRVTANLDKDVADETGNMPLNYKYQGEEVVLALTMLQTTKARMLRVVPGFTADGANVRIGTVPGQNVTKTGKVVHRPFAYPGGEEDFVLEEAVLISDPELTHQHSERMVLDCEFSGLVNEVQEDGMILDSGIGQA